MKCPHCNQNIDMTEHMRKLGKKSGEKRKGDSKYMSELAKKGWIKRNLNKVQNIDSLKPKDQK